jgi:hypothetical protein
MPACEIRFSDEEGTVNVVRFWYANHVVGAAAQQHGAIILSVGYLCLLH